MNKLQKSHKREVARKRKRASLRLLTVRRKTQIKNIVLQNRLVTMSAEKLDDTSATTAANGLAPVPGSSEQDSREQEPASTDTQRDAESS